MRNAEQCTLRRDTRVQNNKLFWRIDYDTKADVGGGSDSILGANGWLKMGMENPQ